MSSKEPLASASFEELTEDHLKAMSSRPSARRRRAEDERVAF